MVNPHILHHSAFKIEVLKFHKGYQAPEKIDKMSILNIFQWWN